MLAQDLNEKAIFAVAISIPVKEAREIYLDQVCKDNSDLRSRVELLLRMQEEEPEFLETPAQHVVATIALANSDSATGQFIGPYKIREKIAEGGMGAVYVAEQTEPVRRKVALKVIRPGMAGPDVVARFEAERQALAMMDHPNIARVLDGGATEEELPYFVMELVQGLPINEYCDQKRLTIRQRLELFVGVCRAVQHAHQKGIIHRDLKPSNVLVAEIDGVAVPKVIDFGIAKALHQKLTDQTVYTQFSQMVGTPLYMSPEQAGLGVIDVDTRSDVYSLGAVLYELLTGETPFDRETLKKATFDEMRRIIREDEPKRPSALVSTLAAEAQSTVAQRRHLDARQHRDSLAGELDWLVMKALDKDRNRRYESANALAADIERYLNDKPVEACPPSTAYRLKKYTQRNRGKLLAVSLVGVALLVSAGSLAAWKWDQSRKQRQVAAEVERSTFAARAAMESGDLEMAEKQLAAARVRAESAALTISDLAVLDDEIQERQRQQEQFDHFQNLTRELWTETVTSKESEAKAIEALELYGVLSDDQWPEKLKSSFLPASQQELVREQVYETLLLLVHPWTQNNKTIDKSMRYLDLAAGFHEPTRSYYLLRRDCYKFLEQPEKVKEMESLRRNMPDSTVFDHFLTGQRAAKGLEAAILDYEKALDLQPDNFRTLFFLAYRLDELGRIEEAVQAYRGCLALQPDNQPTMHNLVMKLDQLGRHEEAMRVANRAVLVRPEAEESWLARGKANLKQGKLEHALHDLNKAMEFGDKHLALILQNRSIVYRGLKRYDMALKDDNKAIELAPKTSALYFNRGTTFQRLGQLNPAIDDFTKAVKLIPKSIVAINGRAHCYFEQQDYDKAVADLERALEINPKQAGLHSNRAILYQKLAQFDHAISAAKNAIELDPKNVNGYVNLAAIYAFCQDVTYRNPKLALEFATKAIELDPNDSYAQYWLGVAQLRSGNFKGAIQTLKAAVEGFEEDDMRAEGFCYLTQSHWELDEREQAVHWYERAIELMSDEAEEMTDDTERVLAETQAMMNIRSERADSTDKKPETP